ncbi:MAG TPA: MOSC domain-containing protein [Pyrinomonadaceae bacterium]|jgi:MOSC domain-containing protein YiiM
MEIISLNVGRPRLVMWRGEAVSTGIYKEPVEGRIKLRTLNLDGDRQADLTVHGGPMKAVYAYPAEHYEFWRAELPRMHLPWGMFGENFTTLGLDEQSVFIGDRFRAGTAELMVTQPRMPCYKLGIKFGRPEILKWFLASGRTGFYFSVIREGEVGRGDTMELIERDAHEVTVSEITRLYAHGKTDVEAMRRAARVEALPRSWRDYFQERIEKAADGRRSVDQGG